MLFVELDGFARLAQIGVGEARSPSHAAFIALIADLTRDDQRPLVELDGLARLAQIGVGEAQVCRVYALKRAIL